MNDPLGVMYFRMFLRFPVPEVRQPNHRSPRETEQGLVIANTPGGRASCEVVTAHVLSFGLSFATAEEFPSTGVV